MAVKLKFHGAARTVTGSCYRLETPHGTLLVDFWTQEAGAGRWRTRLALSPARAR